MDHVAIRRALVAHLESACAPVLVVDEEAAVVAGVCVLVCWTGATSDVAGWHHQFEERILLTGYSDPGPHFAERDNVVRTVARAVHRWNAPGSWKRGFPSLAPRNEQVGGAPHPAVVCRHTVFEPPEID